jgi:hypothetical protein
MKKYCVKALLCILVALQMTEIALGKYQKNNFGSAPQGRLLPERERQVREPRKALNKTIYNESVSTGG